ncbi:uncharacterized protein LMH87_007680 [Akanthomyces muscarius]|uniref:Pro-apoptotic serine protease NMA111 n=1 Tax=Akanthomyces muscarius TaxID=2231603 RepID=A0A9W8QMM5_AKAMU|nr:uncharacterized protein LMH87_007680 [Akanthomyces muscarius]KAJ4161653.1 hypothetical protein LMH87_007680 [Akanthomyces muscarius]
MYPFDGEFAETSEATGFVINAKKGFVVTNRHVAGPGPFWGWCIFNRKEEAPCRPLYIDPIHDFAVLQYELSAIRYTHIDGLDLCPTRALCDQSVLIFGNNGGEEISQHHGSVTLVERNAPEYTDGYRDFNISYYQINVNLSGGISGSPALSADGSVLGIVSGARTDCASVSFVLPSTAIVKALKYLVRGEAVPRGDIRCRFRLTPLYECRGLGLSRDWEDKLRKELPNRDELLVADRVLSNGPAYGKILPGDIILDVNKVCVDNFEKLADILNQKVEQTVLVGLLRETEIMHAEIAVKNLDTIPDRLVRVGEMFCHDLSLVLAVRHGVPVEGVYVAESREPTMIGDGCPDYIIQSINGRELRNVDDFLASLQEFRQGQSCDHSRRS